jgi:alpha-tubulin suppressor-like RCC1 family protein
VPVGGLESGVQAIAAGYSHTCALVGGGVQCWGANSQGQLGNNSMAPESHVPVLVIGLGSGVQALAVGFQHTCALIHGSVQCWGANPNGQLGNNSTEDSRVPVPVGGLESGVRALAAGYSHSCALVNGAAWCWGQNHNGQLGNNSMAPESHVPVLVIGLGSGVQALAAGFQHSCALVNGGAWCWGLNYTGALGTNSPRDRSLVPVPVGGLRSGFQAIAAGSQYTCAVINGGAWCWGANSQGQLGNNSPVYSSDIPVPVAPWAF